MMKWNVWLVCANGEEILFPNLTLTVTSWLLQYLQGPDWYFLKGPEIM